MFQKQPTTGTGLSELTYLDFMKDDPEYFTSSVKTESKESHLVLVEYEYFLKIHNLLQENLEETRKLRAELSQRPHATSITINDLGHKELKVKLPISSIIIVETDEEANARWPETRAYGMGDTLGEAITDLKKNIVDLYFDLKNRELNSLGVIAKNTLKILETHLNFAQ